MNFELLDEPPPQLPKGGASGHVHGNQPDPLLVEFADCLRANIGLWAAWPKVTRNWRKTSWIIVSGTSAAFRSGTFETTIRAHQIYVRCVQL